MVLAYHGIDASLATRDARLFCTSRRSLYGVWPLAIRTATDAGLIGAVECFTGLDAAAPILDAVFRSSPASDSPPARCPARHLPQPTGTWWWSPEWMATGCTSTTQPHATRAACLANVRAKRLPLHG